MAAMTSAVADRLVHVAGCRRGMIAAAEECLQAIPHRCSYFDAMLIANTFLSYVSSFEAAPLFQKSAICRQQMQVPSVVDR